MARNLDPMFNLKTGADSEILFAKEAQNDDKKYVINSDTLTLTRSTGNSINGTTESIESNELRKGRTKSPPRLGNSSSEGTLDLEFSPKTYDEQLEALFRDSFKPWTGDYNSGSDAVRKAAIEAGCTANDLTFYGKTGDDTVGPIALSEFLFKEIAAASGEATTDILNKYTIQELVPGTTVQKYFVTKLLGGTENEDLFQGFKHMELNTFSLDVAIGAIITGSLGFMGTNDPELQLESDFVNTVNHVGFLDGEYESASKFVEGETYYTRSGTDPDYTYTVADPQPTADTFVAGTYYITAGQAFVDAMQSATVVTETDQFTAREGFLTVNGHDIEFATSLNFSYDNGLDPKYAIFVPTAISIPPLTLDITGSIETYVTPNNTESIFFNRAVKAKDNEIIFVLSDKNFTKDDSESDNIYVFQIFKSRFTTHDLSVSGSDTITTSYSFQAHSEQACRILKLSKKGESVVDVTGLDSITKVESADSAVATATYSGLAVTVKAVAAGTTTVTVTGLDSEGSEATKTINVTVAADGSVTAKQA